MIRDAREFIELRTSTLPADYLRAATESAEIEVWHEVIKDFPDMKVWVVRNKTIPVEVLRMLASDSAPEIRLAVATKNKLPNDLMELLANDPDESVRMRIAHNKNANEKILEQLANDPVPGVSVVARQRLEARKQK